MDDTKNLISPSHLAYQVRSNGNNPAHFNRVGAAFAHKDGNGFSIILDAVPVDGRITLRTMKERLNDMKSGKASNAGAVTKADGGDGMEP